MSETGRDCVSGSLCALSGGPDIALVDLSGKAEGAQGLLEGGCLWGQVDKHQTKGKTEKNNEKSYI